jgi:hypothetical protein
MTDRELMQQALDAFGGLLTFNPSPAEYQQGRASVAALRERMSQPEPLFSTPDVTPKVTPYVIDCPRCGHCCPQRQWVGLTDEDYETLSQYAFVEVIEKVEALLKDKNSG